MNSAPQTQRTRRVSASKELAYRVDLLDGSAGDFTEALLERIDDRPVLVVTTPTVGALFAHEVVETLQLSGVRATLMVLACRESTKSLSKVERICARATRERLGRRAVFVGFGGGVCMDLTTVAASLVRRGINHIRVPTTLVGQIDAAIGAKGAVNFQGNKSYLGCFHPPKDVLVNPIFLQTLSMAQLRDGLAELIKMALVCDGNLFEELTSRTGQLLDPCYYGTPQGRDLLWRAIGDMLDHLEPNLFEDRAVQRAVDFGHSFSPLIESASDYKMSHGHAVAIDMALTVTLASLSGLLPDQDRERIVLLLAAVGLPIWSPLLTPELCRRALRAAALHRGGCANLVMLESVGKVRFLVDEKALDDDLLREAIRRLAELSAARQWNLAGGMAS